MSLAFQPTCLKKIPNHPYLEKIVVTIILLQREGHNHREENSKQILNDVLY
jgi:hypothetical protein